jgi:hypothetical protein
VPVSVSNMYPKYWKLLKCRMPYPLAKYGVSHVQCREPDPKPKQQESQHFALAEPEP